MKIIEKNFFQFFIFYNFFNKYFTSVVVGRLAVFVDVKASYCCRVHFCSFFMVFLFGIRFPVKPGMTKGSSQKNPFPDTWRGVSI